MRTGTPNPAEVKDFNNIPDGCVIHVENKKVALTKK